MSDDKYIYEDLLGSPEKSDLKDNLDVSMDDTCHIPFPCSKLEQFLKDHRNSIMCVFTEWGRVWATLQELKDNPQENVSYHIVRDSNGKFFFTTSDLLSLYYQTIENDTSNGDSLLDVSAILNRNYNDIAPCDCKYLEDNSGLSFTTVGRKVLL